MMNMKNELLLQLEIVTEVNRQLPADADGIVAEEPHGAGKLAGHITSSAGKGNAGHTALRANGVTEVMVNIDVTPECACDRHARLKTIQDAKAFWNSWLGIPARRF
jgi:hypothetical protein